MKKKKKKKSPNVISIGKHSRLEPANVTVKTIDGSLISGAINLGFESRISDVFIASDNQFVVMFDAKIVGETSEKVIIVNKNHVVWIQPEDDLVSFGK
jgi:hypothetical protein